MNKIIKIAIVIIGALVLVYAFYKKPVPVSAPEPEPTIAPLVKTACFLRSEGKTNIKDIYVARITTDENMKVSGDYAWIPGEKDSARGTIMGTIDKDGLIHAMYDYMIEGSNQKQEWFARMSNEGLFLGEGELTEKKEINGGIYVLRYKDPTLVKYEKKLEKVECDTVGSYFKK